MMEAKNAVKQNRLHLRTNTGPTSRLLLFFGAQTQLTEAEQLPALTDGGLE